MTSTPMSLLERLRQPADAEAWTTLVRLIGPLLFQWARRTGLDDAAAADLVQDVFTVLVEKLPDFEYDPSKSFRAWLKTVLLNKWREGQRRRRVPLAMAVALDEVAAPEPPSDDEYRDHLVQAALERIRGDFRPATWAAFEAHAHRGRPAADVARELGMTPVAVRIAKSRVLARLRSELAGLLD